jgi:pyruvate dehydrogenase E1 component alpha subunit
VEVQELVDFEEEIKDLFLQKKIRCPIHLAGGVNQEQEKQLIEIFKNIKPEDWVFASHRSHFHALLKGVPKERVKQEIINEHSMHLCFKDYNFISSSIVGGVLPIALGVALGIKRDNKENHVWVFVGDMASSIGVFHECTQYATRNNLPITFVVEDNGVSCDTPTQETWGLFDNVPDIIKVNYKRVWPHVGCGEFVRF